VTAYSPATPRTSAEWLRTYDVAVAEDVRTNICNVLVIGSGASLRVTPAPVAPVPDTYARGWTGTRNRSPRGGFWNSEHPLHRSLNPGDHILVPPCPALI
jgi:hypothetical protein